MVNHIENAGIMTIKEIAREANVSIGTVDRVVHGRGRVAQKTTELVKKIIQESGYKPNIFGSRLSLSKDYIFAVIMPRLHQDFEILGNIRKRHQSGSG